MVNPGTATATDNCSVVSVVGVRSDGMALDAPYPGPVGVGSRKTSIVWTATDGSGNTASCTQVITVTNAAPISDAGPDQVVSENTAVTLTGIGNDPDPGQAAALAYQWTQTGGPAVVLNNADTSVATFTAPESADLTCVALTFQLTVTDPCGATVTDTVIINVTDTFVVRDDRNGHCVVIRLVCSGNTGTYCWRKPDGSAVSGPCMVTVTGSTMTAQSTAADPNVFQAGADLRRRIGNARMTQTRAWPTQTSSIVDSNITDSTCVCP
jgi:hypothetical protein